MQTIATIGLDIAKSVFQVHGVDAAGQVVVRRQLKRRQVLAFCAKLGAGLILWAQTCSRRAAAGASQALPSGAAGELNRLAQRKLTVDQHQKLQLPNQQSSQQQYPGPQKHEPDGHQSRN